MATSGTFDFNLEVDEVIEDAFEQIGLEIRNGYDARSARRSLNLLLTEWANEQITLWTVQRQIIPCVIGQADYELGANVVDLMEVAVRIGVSDYVITRTSRSESAYIPQKDRGGRPTQFWFDRQVPAVIKVWPVPDREMSLMVDLFTFTEDVSGSAQGVAAPRRFIPAMIQGLAYKMALKKAPQRVATMKQLYDEALRKAMNADEETSSFTVRPRAGARRRP